MSGMDYEIESLRARVAERRVDELEAAVRDAVAVVNELVAWVNTDNVGCMEVMQRGEQMLLRLRRLVNEWGDT